MLRTEWPAEARGRARRTDPRPRPEGGPDGAPCSGLRPCRPSSAAGHRADRLRGVAHQLREVASTLERAGRSRCNAELSGDVGDGLGTSRSPRPSMP
jgi:hypothetical protein